MYIGIVVRLLSHRKIDEKKEPILSAYKIDFGKYKNKTLCEIAKENPNYLFWLSVNRVMLERLLFSDYEHEIAQTCFQ